MAHLSLSMLLWSDWKDVLLSLRCSIPSAHKVYSPRLYPLKVKAKPTEVVVAYWQKPYSRATWSTLCVTSVTFLLAVCC